MEVPGQERALGVERLQEERARWPVLERLERGELEGLQRVDAFLAERRFAHLAKIYGCINQQRRLRRR